MSKLIGIPLGWIMYFLYNFIPNYGICIILFTLVTKIILFPTAYKSQLGTARMQSINPKLAQLKKQYANNQQKLAEEQQKLYQQEGVNPMGSCLPMIIQMIILYGVFYVVYRPISHILRLGDYVNQAKDIIINNGWYTEAQLKSREELYILQAVKDHKDAFAGLGDGFADKVAEFKNTFLGVDLGSIPTIHPEGGWTKTAVALVMIPVVSGLVQLIYTIYTQRKSKKMNPDMPSMGAMNIVMFIMPLFSVWLAFTVPAGVGFYWIWSSVFAFIQSIGLYAYFTPERIKVISEREKEKSKNKKPGFMQKMMDQQAAMLAQQEEAKKAGRHDYSAETEGMSKSERQAYNRQLINEARKRMAEKYGDEYSEENDDE
ncbi:MAG: YidC/Oxa1 family membrane protein insertase [Porcipelethomonas sp.]